MQKDEQRKDNGRICKSKELAILPKSNQFKIYNLKFIIYNLQSSDLEKIKQLEEILGFKLKRVNENEITRKDFNTWVFALSFVESLAYPFKGARNYSLDNDGFVTGLSLDYSPVFLLEYLDEILSSFKNLIFVSLKNDYLPDYSFLKELKGLTNVNLSDNKVSEVPKWLAEKNLPIVINDEYSSLCLNLAKNPITRPPAEIVESGNNAIVNYYNQLETQGADYLYEAKMLIVGEGGAGKTTLAHKIKDPDCKLPSIDDRTKGISIITHTFPLRDNHDREFRLNVWDFGGQEMYHSTHRFFLSNRSVYVLVSDNRKDDTDFNYWLNLIENYGGESPILIILNEKDDIPKTINVSELRGRYDNLKEIVSVNFKTNEENSIDKKQKRIEKIKEIFRKIEDNTIDLQNTVQKFPAGWIKVRESLIDDSRNHFSREDFDKICSDNDIKKEEDINTLLDFFHNLGIALNFRKIPSLENIIMKPAWATNAVYKIFDNEMIKNKMGRFTINDCREILKENEYKYTYDKIIELMKSFKLVYEIEHSGKLICPQMLSDNTPDYSWDTSSSNSTMEYKFDKFMPKGILWELIVRMYRYIENHNFVWKEGVILKRENVKAEIKENISDRRIYIRFSGEGIPEFRAIICDELDDICNSYHRLEYDKMIPCLCDDCSKSDKPHLFKYNDLVKAKEKARRDIQCYQSYKDVNIESLLEGFRDKQERGGMRHRENQNLTNTKMKKIFLSYAHEDEEFKEKIDEHLSALKRKNLIETYNDRKIIAGKDWDVTIKEEMEAADIILFLVSSSFIASDYIWNHEIPLAKERQKKGKCIVVPIIVRPCDWTELDFAKHQALPKDAKPISESKNRDKDYLYVVNRLKELLSD